MFRVTFGLRACENCHRDDASFCEACLFGEPPGCMIDWRISALGLAVVLPGCEARHPLNNILPPPVQEFAETIEAVKHSVAPVACSAVSAGGSVRLDFIVGSAFFISKEGAFVTAGHVITDMQPGPGRRRCEQPAIFLPKTGQWPNDGRLTDIQWFRFSIDQCVLSSSAIDLARCKTQDDVSQSKEINFVLTPVIIEPVLPKDGVEVAFTGFPLQIPLPRTARGSVAGYGSANGIDTSELVIDKNAWPGASGSPVYLVNGHVIGVVLARGANDAAGLALARTGNLVARFLQFEK